MLDLLDALGAHPIEPTRGNAKQVAPIVATGERSIPRQAALAAGASGQGAYGVAPTRTGLSGFGNLGERLE